MKFKVGDRVKAIANTACKNIKGYKGTIIRASNATAMVEFDEYIGGHSGDCGKDGHCWAVDPSILEKIDINYKIVITTDGNETLARLYEGNKVIKSATAKCSPDDTFDFNTGARIAFDRLIGEEKKHEYKVGQIYRVDGDLTNSKGKIKITEIRREWIYYKVVEGMCGWSPTSFMIGSAFDSWLTLIEEEPKIKVGDKVKVINNGKNYSIYSEWIERNAPDLAIHYAYGGSPENETLGIVKRIAPHTKDNNRTLYAIEVGLHGTIYLIGEKGIKKVEG